MKVTIIDKEGGKKVIKISDMEPGYPLPIEQWINACTGKGENICDIDAGVLVNKVLDASSKAIRDNCTVDIDDI